MDGSQHSETGFPPHLQQQLREAAMAVPTPSNPPNRDRGQTWRGRGHPHSGRQHHHQGQTRQYMGGSQRAQVTDNQPWGRQTVSIPADFTSFPPLGTTPSEIPATNQRDTTINVQQYPSQINHSNASLPAHGAPMTRPVQDSRRDFYVRGRGGQHRGRGYNHFNNDQRQHIQGQGQTLSANDFQRPPPIQKRLFTGSNHQFQSHEDQRAFQRRIMDQSDFLNHLANQSLKNQLTAEEQQAKELFRKELEAIAQKVIADARTESMTIDPSHVQLKLYGSLGSGFGVAGSDMDLLLAFPQNEGPLGNIEIESRRMLEKALLDADIGARLLTNTRVPILRVCQKPNPELLKNLRECRSRWEQGLDNHDPLPIVDEGFGDLPFLTDSQSIAAAEALAGLDLSAHEVPLPESPQLEHAKLEYVGDCGIQCDINFSNYVALHNTRLLRTYGSCDSRVRQVGVFVKSWAKARDINTPYRGTLSSYGYILMVLHYLMHVVNPPLIPNLQELAKQKDSWDGKTNVELVEGFDVRFVRDSNEIQDILQGMPRNHESVGSLLRGFFWYYGDPRGFHWNQDVISFRSHNGRLSKKSKGWTEAKWSESNSNVRLRYLLAIEDPFELDHNVARTVGHSGVVAIRDEFRRAWAAVDNIKFDDEARIWYWPNPVGQKVQGDELMSVMENRGDLLRKDQEYHRSKMRQMRLELEAKEKTLQEGATREAENVEEKETNGTFKKSQSVAQDVKPLLNSSSSTLIYNDNFQVKKFQKPPNRRVLREDDDEEASITQPVKTGSIDWDRPFNETEISINAEWVDNAVDQVKPEGVTVDWSQQLGSGIDWSHQLEGEPNSSQQLKGDVAWSQQLEGDIDTSKTRCDDHKDVKDMNFTFDEPHLDEGVEVKIEWDIRSKAGRWLRWRDRRIRAGTWAGTPTPNYRRLDEEFPYDPNMTMMELAIKNKILCSLYLNSFVPKRQTDQLMSSDAKPHSERSAPKGNLQTPSVTTNSADLISPVDLKSETSTKPTSSTVSRSKKKRRPQRKQPKKLDRMKNDSNPILESHQSTTPHHEQDDKQPNLATEAISPTAIELLKLFKNSPPHHDITTTNNVQPLNSTLPPDPQIPSTTPTPTPLHFQPQAQSQPSLQPSDPHLQTPPTPRVPLTLYPNLPSSTRPRDEDPNIMPIPRNLNFQFDPRQLADLEVIRRGGNGCARFGDEFDIEVDNEFGGGGEMEVMDRASDGHDSEMELEIEEEKKEAWDGKGDVDGLLGELPGCVDDLI